VLSPLVLIINRTPDGEFYFSAIDHELQKRVIGRKAKTLDEAKSGVLAEAERYLQARVTETTAKAHWNSESM
jgi:hypothetical protein